MYEFILIYRRFFNIYKINQNASPGPFFIKQSDLVKKGRKFTFKNECKCRRSQYHLKIRNLKLSLRLE